MQLDMVYSVRLGLGYGLDYKVFIFIFVTFK